MGVSAITPVRMSTRAEVALLALVGTVLASSQSLAIGALYPASASSLHPTLAALLWTVAHVLACAAIGLVTGPLSRRLEGWFAETPAPLAVLLCCFARGIPHWRAIFQQDPTKLKSVLYLGLLLTLALLPALLTVLARRAASRGRLSSIGSVAAALVLASLVQGFTGAQRAPVQASTVVVPEPRETAGSLPETVVILTFDTLRADHLSSHGYGRSTSTELDRYLERGRRYTRGLAPKGHTGPSLASLLTGLYPPRHGALRHGWSIAPGIPTLPALLPPHYVSAAFVANPVVRHSVEQAGFDFSFVRDNQDARQITARARRWIEEQEGKSVLLWVHIFEPHGPYKHRPADLAGIRQVAPVAPGDYDLEQAAARFGLPATDEAKIRARVAREADRYDASIRFATSAAAELLDQIVTLRGHPLLIVSSDHGESLHEHDYFFSHGDLIYQPVVHVPVVISHPDLDLQGESSVPASLVDVLPTLCPLVGCVGNAAFDGVDLLDPRAALPERRLFTSGKENPLYLSWCMIQEDWKLIATPRRHLAPLDGLVRLRQQLVAALTGNRAAHAYRARSYTLELYNLSSDPGELADVSDREPGRLHRMSTELMAWLDSQFVGELITRRLGEHEIPADTVEQLRALGYVQ